MVKCVQVVTTVDNEKSAKKIARDLVGKRLAACVQISNILSTYWWKNKIEEKNEISKTDSIQIRGFENRFRKPPASRSD